MLHQIIYSSRALIAPHHSRASILDDCIRNNRRDGITGLLLCDGVRFLQALEGHESLVRRCYDRIAVDERHNQIELIRAGPVPVRQFGNWSMNYKQLLVTDRSGRFMDELRSSLAEVTDPDMLALFVGFGALSNLR